jgi:hypothetical protein
MKINIRTAVLRDDSDGSRRIIHEADKQLDPIGMLAASMVERWGMVAAVDNGEDSAGRAQLRLAEPEELVERALDCAQLLFAGAERRGLVFEPASVIERLAQERESLEKEAAYGVKLTEKRKKAGVLPTWLGPK